MTFSAEELQEIDKILNNFKKQKTNEEIFYNMCFCICVPQTKFSSNLISIENLKNEDFYNNDIHFYHLTELIKKSRFKNRKAKFLIEFKKNWNNVSKLLTSHNEPKELRNWLVKNVKGIGMKTASHFLRNMGFDDLAIIDTHIKKFLGIGNKFDYLEVEKKFRSIAKERQLSVAQLDGLIWKRFSKTNSESFVY